MIAWLLSVLGISNMSGRWYAFWSGAGADLGELAIAGSLLRLAARQVDALAQAARHHRERQELAAAQHADLKNHTAAQLKAHCADLKSHVSAVGSHVPQQLSGDIAKAPKRKPGGDAP